MSALTDLFTALANKIRSKTGTATTYTPLEMVSDGIDDVYDAGYAAGGGGGVTPTSITPSDSSPASMSAGTAYEPTVNGYAIESYSNVTPSSSGTYFASGIAKMLTSGYAYDSQPAACKTGSVTTSTSTTTYVNLGFEPKYIAVIAWQTYNKFLVNIYNSDVTSNYQIRAVKASSDSSSAVGPPMPYTGTGTNYIASIDSTGFTLTKVGATYGTTAYYFAIG